MKCTINKSQVKAKVEGAWKETLWALSNEILADCNEYVKRDQNTLMLSSLSHSRPSEGVLVWETPYAKRQYWEIQTALTPGTCWKWCEAAKVRHKAEWENIAQRRFLDNL
ncbi:MAG: hypothetical protein J6P40_02705 [Oscillospiraceae bacterium]|nr:hypothetical protein [Oscillospiraceae bacterium]